MRGSKETSVIVEVPGSKKLGIRPIPVTLNGTTAVVQVIVPRFVNRGATFTIGIAAIGKERFTTRRRIANSVAQATQAAPTGVNACWQENFQSFKCLATKTIRATTWHSNTNDAMKVEMFYSFPLQTLTFYQDDVPSGVIMGMADISDRTLYAFLGISKMSDWFSPYPYVIQARCPIVRIYQKIPSLKQISRTTISRMLQNSQLQSQDLQIPTSLKEYIEKGPKIIEKLKTFEFDSEKYRNFHRTWFSPTDFISGEATDLESQGTHEFEL